MCLNPRKAVTRSNYINATTIGSQVYSTFNCGKCAECLQAKHYEYEIRSGAQYRATIEKGGFCYWDTLTYDQEHVPVFNPCLKEEKRYTYFHGFTRGFSALDYEHGILTFDAADYRLFFKRLRTNLTRDGYEVNGNLKYFFVSEYGGQTHRPHYHFILYVTIPNMTPRILEKFVDESWSLGRIDRDKSADEKVIDGFGAINYVAKYVTKDDEYMKVLKNLKDKYAITDEEFHKLLPFHRQSQGFGIDIIKQQDYDFMFKTNQMVTYDSYGKKIVPIPTYIKRKLWYTHFIGADGKLHWKLNEEGIKWSKFNMDNKINKLAERYQEAFDNFGKYVDLSTYSIDLKKEVADKLGSRTFRDVAEYQFLYKGKLNTLGNHFCPLPSEMVEYMFGQDYGFDLSSLEETIKNHPDIGSCIDLGQIFYRVKDGFMSFDGFHVSFDDFLQRYMISQETFPQFSSFDYIIGILNIFMREVSKVHQTEYEKRVALKNRIKKLKSKYGY